MKLKLQGGSRGNQGNLMGVEVTSKININKSIVTLVTLVTSIISRACEGAKNISIHAIHLSDTPLLCKIEVTKVTEVTRHLMIAVFLVTSPLQKLPLVTSTLQPGGLLMSEAFSPELGLTQEDLLERLLSQGLAKKVKKRIGGRVYEVLAIDAKVLEELRK